MFPDLSLLFFVYTILVGMLAFVYTYLLTEPGQIFGRLNNFLYYFFENDKREMKGKPMHPLYMVLIYCEKCVSGQIALWSFLILHFHAYAAGEWILFFPHLLFIALSIFFSTVVKAFYIKIIE
ncbi:MAG: hypothetical protein M3R27_14905 [Bacteroidota bacterium]|nr:hypothetical protein [Bacteroidota bacterium]